MGLYLVLLVCFYIVGIHCLQIIFYRMIVLLNVRMPGLFLHISFIKVIFFLLFSVLVWRILWVRFYRIVVYFIFQVYVSFIIFFSSLFYYFCFYIFLRSDYPLNFLNLWINLNYFQNCFMVWWGFKYLEVNFLHICDYIIYRLSFICCCCVLLSAYIVSFGEVSCYYVIF